MKKTLAILLVALVALTSVFAANMESSNGTKTLTLVDTIDSTTTWKLQYKIGDDGTWLDLDEDKINEKSIDVDFTTSGYAKIQVLLDANTSTGLSRTFTITTEGIKRIEGDNKVDSGIVSSLSVTPKNEENLFSSSLSDSTVTVSVDSYKRFGGEKQVLESTLSWTGKSDLIAGNYEVAIKVEYSAE